MFHRLPRATFTNKVTRCKKTALFWVITQRVVLISYRRFGTTYRSLLQGPRSQEEITTTVCVMTQKGAGFLSFEAEV